MKNHPFGRVEDYTSAFLWMFYLVLVVGLVIVWGVWGYMLALTICFGLHLGIARFAIIRAQREADWDARVAAAIARGKR